jgi:hypothetical protein
MQTSYAENLAGAQLGMLGDAGFTDKVSRYSAAVIPYGRCVIFDTTPGKVKLPAAAADVLDANSESRKVEGIVLRTEAIEVQPDNVLGVAGANVPAYPIGYSMSILRKGRVWVWAEEAVTVTDQVFVRHTAAVNEVPGNFRQDVDTANAELLHGARFLTATAAAGLVLLEINLTN